MAGIDSADLLLLIAGYLFTITGTLGYRSFALRREILANPNFRSSHERPTPRGGGIVFSLVSIVGIAALWLMGMVASNLALALVAGGTGAALIGFLDDVRHLGARWKLLAQGILATLVLLCLGGQPFLHLFQGVSFIDLTLSWLGLVWLMNVYNFVDGIDALAATGAVFISSASALLIVVASSDTQASDLGLALVLGLLAVSTLAFLGFNWPAASVFMGDSGSLFLGFAFGSLMADTVVTGRMTIWTWSILLAYLLGDTTTTTIVRLFVTPKWYGEHRSHAYQNVARMLDSHLAVVIGVLAYSIVWLLPLALWSTLSPSTGPVASLLALTPVVGWTLRYGPLKSSV
jgi:Fuc2NAc and GlcNAc transferase